MLQPWSMGPKDYVPQTHGTDNLVNIINLIDKWIEIGQIILNIEFT
jgi:hypothetical protein